MGLSDYLKNKKPEKDLERDSTMKKELMASARGLVMPHMVKELERLVDKLIDSQYSQYSSDYSMKSQEMNSTIEVLKMLHDGKSIQDIVARLNEINRTSYHQYEAWQATSNVFNLAEKGVDVFEAYNTQGYSTLSEKNKKLCDMKRVENEVAIGKHGTEKYTLLLYIPTALSPYKPMKEILPELSEMVEKASTVEIAQKAKEMAQGIIDTDHGLFDDETKFLESFIKSMDTIIDAQLEKSREIANDTLDERNDEEII